MRKLYNYKVSGNCHKIRIMLGLLDLEYEKVTIDLTKKDHLAPEFLAINPMHKVPVLDDNGVVLADSSAILVYLARTYKAGHQWYPTSPQAMAEIQKWLSFAVNEVFNGLALSRALVIFNRPLDRNFHNTIAHGALAILEQRLTEREWLALDQPTIADIACYPYAAVVEEGELSLEPYPAVRAWIDRLEAIENFAPMPRRAIENPHDDG
ncbi:MAG: glutathione S-transferase family protein [Pseudomonadota bacterium]